MFALQICCHATFHQVFFTEQAEAQAQLDALAPKIGLDRYSRNDKDLGNHTIKCVTGDVVVACEKVEVARIVDMDAEEAMMKPVQDAAFDKDLARRVRLKQALAAVVD